MSMPSQEAPCPEDLAYLLTFNSFPSATSPLYQALLQKFGSLKEAFRASPSHLAAMKGVGAGFLESLAKDREADWGKREWEKASQLHIRILTQADSNYPPVLRQSYGPPLVLYVKGEIRPEDDVALAIVGTRHPTYYGQKMAERFGEEVALAGFTVVSGLARGVDTYAHRGALKVSGGRTMAVLGSGLQHVYPFENKRLAEKIAEQGAVISEFFLDMPPHAQNFPARNRIISGLSLGVLVVEAPGESGALITVRFALEQNKDVFVVPGRLDSPQSQGSNELLKEGAQCVTCLEDIVSEYELRYPGRFHRPAAPDLKKNPGEEASPGAKVLSDSEQLILLHLSDQEPQSMDLLLQKTKLPVATLTSSLLTLELRRQVKQFPGRLFVRN